MRDSQTVEMDANKVVSPRKALKQTHGKCYKLFGVDVITSVRSALAKPRQI